MSKDYELECDECGSHEIKKELVTPPKPPNKKIIKMSEYKPRNKYMGSAILAVMTYSQYKLVCKNCGHESKEFTE